MKIKFYSILAGLILLALGSQAQTIRGIVSDTSQTIIGATVAVSGNGPKAGTNSAGRYELKLPKAGTYTISVTSWGIRHSKRK